MVSRNEWGLSFHDICLTIEEKKPKHLNQENWPNWGLNLGSLGERQRCYPPSTAVVEWGKWIQFSWTDDIYVARKHIRVNYLSQSVPSQDVS